MSTSTPIPGIAAAPPPDWVPVERRFLGIDRRTIAPALVVLIIAIFMHWGLGQINDHIDYKQQIKAGDVIDLGNQQLTFQPAVGWGRADGILIGESKTDASLGAGGASLFWGDTEFTVKTGPFKGTPDELIDQINKVNDQLDDVRGLGTAVRRQSGTTASGLTGVVESFDGVKKIGLVAAFVVDAKDAKANESQTIGVEITVIGSSDTIRDRLADIAKMIDTLKYDPNAGASS